MNIVLMEPLGITKEALEDLSSFLIKEGHCFTAYDTRETDQEKLAQRVKDAEIIMLANQPLSAEIVAQCKNLKYISIAFTGVDHVAVADCKAQKVVLSNAAGYSTNAVAELAYGLMIGLYRSILPCDGITRQGGTKGALVGRELTGKTLGIIGTGEIGLRVAEIGKVFGCKLIAYSRTKKKEAEAMGIEYKTIEEVMSESDIVSVHMPLNAGTKGFIDADKLALMKKSAIIINTARGPVIDNQALATALKDGKIAGAGIDVFDMEPPIPKDYPLLDCPNTILTPHIAFATEEALYDRAIIAFDNVRKFLAGAPQNLV